MNKIITWTVDNKDRNNFSFGGTVQVGCTSRQLWDLLVSPGHLTKVHPACERHETEEWVGVGSKDVVFYKDGAKRIRTVVQWNLEQFIQLKVEDPIGDKESQVSYTIKNLPNNNSEITILLQTDEYKNIPRIFWKFYVRKKLVPRYKKYLEGLLVGFSNYKPKSV